jgi:pimeloyl-ACP methyl ester carboxylesterase
MDVVRTAMAGFVPDPAIATAALAHEMLSIFAAPGLVNALVSAARDDIGEHAEDIAVRTLLIWGAADRVVPLSVAQGLAARLPQAQLVSFPRVGHCPMLERANDFNTRVADWVGEQPLTPFGSPSL